MANKAIAEYEIRDHGIEHAQYFTGAGVSFTRWTDCYTGCGSSPQDAVMDACDQLFTSGWELPASMEPAFQELTGTFSDTVPETIAEQPEEGELYCYVTIFVR